MITSRRLGRCCRRMGLALTTLAGCVSGLSLAASGLAAAPATAAPVQQPPSTLPVYLNTHYPPAVRAADLVSRMTLAEKVSQLRSGYYPASPAIPRLGVQEYSEAEGQHGIGYLGNYTIGGQPATAQATSFPTNFASTMSWDPGLVYQETTAISDEARGFLDKSLFGTGQNNLGPSKSDYGSLMYWAPTVNMDRDPRWGRTDEAFGEDPYLVGKMAGAFVNGYEGNTMNGQSLAGYLKVAATAKHYALNNVENDRTYGSSNTTDSNIRDYYTAPFESLIENAHVSGLMTSYNAINGTPSAADTYTTNELAQSTYGFNGYTTSDCGGVGTVYDNPPLGHDWAPPGWTTDSKGVAGTWTNTATGTTVSAPAGGEAYSLRSGTDLDCLGLQPLEANVTNIEQAIKAGILSEGVIDNALIHVFTVRMETGEFDPASKVPYTKITKNVIQSPAHQALARKVADESLVLLKNDNVAGTSSPLLPASPAKLNNVVIVGDLANKVTLGGYSGDPTYTSSPVQGITAAVKAANPNATVTFDACGTSTTATTPAACSAQTQAAIKTADLVIVFAGTDASVHGEGHDRSSLAMPGNYDSLISQVHALGNPRTALVIQSDGPVGLGNVQDDFPAIVFSGYNGQDQGTALADVLTGKQDPAGHLDFTWYKDDSQLPGIENYGLTPSQTGGLGRTYMYFTGTPTYPFGYGLSYTHFTYSNINVAPKQITADRTVNVNFNVTNTGGTAGATVAQLYVAPQFSVPGVELPKEQLEGFQRTAVLQPGQTQHITLPVKISKLSHWDENALKQVVYDGPYQFRIGGDSADFAATPTVNVTGAITPHVQTVAVQPDQVTFSPGDTLDLTGNNPWIADDTNPALEQPHAEADHIVEAVNNDQSFANLASAHVTYSSSDPAVATVSPAGKMTAVAPGAASIDVTVNGVTGSTPIVVQDPYTLTMPATATRGSTITATTTLTNPGTQPLSEVTQTLTVPEGWTATATSPATFASVAPGQTVTTTWAVTVPADIPAGSSFPYADVAFRSAAGPYTENAVTQVAAAYPSLAAAFDNPGISDNSSPSAGNLDGGGLSYSAQALAAAGLTPGATIHHDGLAFTWPDVPAGQSDNVIARGQAIAISGSGSTLGFLGTGNSGTASGTGTIYYTDGTSQQFNLTLPDWWANTAPPDGDILTTMPYINSANGRLNQPVSLYYAAVPLQQGKTISAVVLPDVNNGQNAMHIFAIATGPQEQRQRLQQESGAERQRNDGWR